MARSTPSRENRTGGGAGQRQQHRFAQPCRGNQNLQGRRGLFQNRFHQKGDQNSTHPAKQRQHQRFAEQQLYDIQPRTSQRFQNSNFTGTFQHHGVHVEQHHQKADHHSNRQHGSNKWF